MKNMGQYKNLQHWLVPIERTHCVNGSNHSNYSSETNKYLLSDCDGYSHLLNSTTPGALPARKDIEGYVLMLTKFNLHCNLKMNEGN